MRSKYLSNTLSCTWSSLLIFLHHQRVKGLILETNVILQLIIILFMCVTQSTYFEILNFSNRISCSSVMTVIVATTCIACLHHFLHLQRAPGAADFVLWNSTRSKARYSVRILPWHAAPQDIGLITLIAGVVLKSGMAYMWNLQLNNTV
jgi:hypothetical protein